MAECAAKDQIRATGSRERERERGEREREREERERRERERGERERECRLSANNKMKSYSWFRQIADNHAALSTKGYSRFSQMTDSLQPSTERARCSWFPQITRATVCNYQQREVGF